MFFGEIPMDELANVSLRMWRAPVDVKSGWFEVVYVVGCIDDFHIVSVRLSSIHFVVLFLFV
jgi:hypothetical protein